MSNKDCNKYKELIMEKIDGEICDNDRIQLDIHLKSCKNCNIYFNKMERIKKATNSLIYDIPPFIEEKIMSKITDNEYKQPAFVFNLRRVFSYGVSFAIVIFVSIFLIYNTFDNKIVKVSDMPVNKETQISKQVKNIDSQQQIEKIEEVITKIARKDTDSVNKQDNINNISRIPEKQEKEIAQNLADKLNTNIQTKPQQDYNVRKTDTIQPGISAAKVTPIPPVPYNPLLEQDKAIVANNVINPLRGDKAIIRFVVDDTAFVKITIYDKNIRPISKILNEEKGRGTYEATWSGKNDSNEIVSEGIYFVYIQIGTRVIKKSIIVNK